MCITKLHIHKSTHSYLPLAVQLNFKHPTQSRNSSSHLNFHMVQISHIPRLTGRESYAAWRTRIEAAFLILDVWDVIE